MKPYNMMKLEFLSKSTNEAFARATVAAFAASLDPTIEEMNDIKTAVSEAVTNCIVHGYRDTLGKIYITASLFENNRLVVQIRDKGCGIENLEQAMQPLFTTGNPSERAGLGFSVMQSFMDKLKVRSTPGKGTVVVMEKTISIRGFHNDGKQTRE